jgi:hypothetical protein
MKRMTKQQLFATAYHEAGDAVVAIDLGTGLGRKGVSIIPDEERLHPQGIFRAARLWADGCHAAWGRKTGDRFIRR